MVDYAENFTKDTPDSEGRYLIGSDQIIGTHYYDSTEESWRVDYSALSNPFANPDFSFTTVTGSVGSAGNWYETGTDTAIPVSVQRFFKVGKLPFDYEDELLATYGVVISNSATANGAASAAGVAGDFFIDAANFSAPKNTFPTNYTIAGFDGTDRWATTSGIPGGPYGRVAWQLTPPQEVAGFYLDSYDADETTAANSISACIREYLIQIGNTGTGTVDSDYTTIASGTLPFGTTHPIWVDVPPTTAKYVRVLFKNNGSTVRSGLGKVFAYNSETINRGMSLVITRVMGSTVSAAGRTFAINQLVDFTGINRVYFDVKDYSRDTSNQFEVFTNSVRRVDPLVPNALSANDIYSYVRGISVDVSGDGSNTVFQVSKTMSNTLVASSGFLALTNFTHTPGWYSETPSATRGSSPQFPDRAFIVVDTKGMSIIDADNMTLWMRFNLGARKMLQQRPRKVVAKEGRLYLATSRGLYIIDFDRNRCTRFDERGIWHRYGIDYRNENSFDFEEWTVNTIPQRLLHEYIKLTGSVVIPEFGINDIDVGEDSTFGSFVLLGTNKGLMVFNDEFASAAEFLTSLDTDPVSKVKVSNGSIWYLQGEGSAQRVSYISTVNAANADGFSPEETYYKDVEYSESLSGALDSDAWEIVQQDPAMVLEEGSVLTISGSHIRSGTTGLIYRNKIADRSFSARIKVKILDFPSDARGAVRFGVCQDYKHLGLFSLDSDGGANERSGFFISAFNIDPYGWPGFGSNPFDTDRFYDGAGWFYAAQDVGGDNVGKIRKIGTPTVDGIKLKSYGSKTGGSATTLNVLDRMSSVQPVLARDFTVRLDVQVSSGFTGPTSAFATTNPNMWLGISRSQAMVPGATGTGDSIDSAMILTGNTTFSGVMIYTVGTYTDDGNPADLELIQPKLRLGSTENTGHTTSPYREWRMDYNHSSNDVRYYLDDAFVGSYKSTSHDNPNRFGLCFGIGLHHTTAGVSKTGYFKNLRVEYPPLISGSRYKYGLEASNEYGDITPVFAHYPTYSGISMSPDTVPASGTLASSPLLSNGDLLTGAQAMGLNVSVGVGLPGRKTVEALYIYDSTPGSSGWNSSSSKRIEVWHSPDNVLWSFYKEYDMSYQERVSGLTKIRFSPAIEDKFIKLHGLSTTYNILGGSSWTISEIRPMTISGTDFYGSDNSPSADFHEWRLDYNATTKEVRGYIDDVLVSKAYHPEGVDGSKFVIAHDLSVVSSGTDSTFHGEFKDFVVSFDGVGSVSTGDITAMEVNHNVISGTHNNYTLMTGSTEGVIIADFDTSPSPVADVIRTFSHAENIFGATEKTSTIIADRAAHRNQGLVLIGTSRFKASKYVLAGKRPIWFEKWGDEGLDLDDEALSYGNKHTLAYHPSLDKLFIIHDANSAYFTVADLKDGSWYQLSRESFKDTTGASSTGDFQSGSAKAVYSPYDERMWILSSPDRFGGVDLTTGDFVEGVYDNADFENIAGSTGGTAGRWFIAYVLHRHRIIFGENYIGVYDFALDETLEHPRNFSTTPKRWNRNRTVLPWVSVSPSNDGLSSAVYSDYDKSIYLIGTSSASPTATNNFYRYDPDKDYLELITAGSEMRSWPTTDSALLSETPVNLSTAKGSRLIYDNRRKRVYLISERGVRALLMYYDVITREWVEVGEEPPYTSLRTWPNTAPTEFSTDTNFAAYNPNNGSIYLATGRGDAAGSYVYEYYPEETVGSFGFDYIPSRDGVPPASGIARQFTTFTEIVEPNYTSSVPFERDFYLTSNKTSSDAKRFSYTFGPSYITISGNGSGPSGETEVFELFSSAKEFDPIRSFDVSAQIAFPQFTRNILYTPGVSKPAHCYFRMGFSDGLNRAWVNPSWGQEDPDLYQSAELRVGVSGTINNSATQFPFVAHIAYVDGFNTNGDTITTDPKTTYDSYLSGGINLGTSFSNFRDFRLSYTYDTDLVEGFLDGVSIGSTTLRRKFDSNGVRLHLGFSMRATDNVGNPKSWVANIKNLKLTTKAWDRIENNRLLMSVSGSVGSYAHERYDSTLVPGVDWAYSIDARLPSSVRYSGFDYIATLGGIGDGNKLVELVAFVAGQKKMVGIVGDIDRKDDSDTYLGTVENIWDAIEGHTYLVSRDTLSNSVSVYIDGLEDPSIVVSYEDLPGYQFQHVYYGKSNYGAYEKIYENPTLSGTWTPSPNYTGGSDPALGKLVFNSNAKFATITQGTAARAIYTLDSDLGDVDLYTFYHAAGFDSAKNVPYTIVSSGTLDLPDSSGDGFNVLSISDQTDEFGNFDAGKITIRIDQRRVQNNKIVSGDKNFSQASGWIYLGRYSSPSSVIITAGASGGPGTTQAFVCADAIGVDIGRYGRSTFDMSIDRVRYEVGTTELLPDAAEVAGITIVDLSTNTVIDEYGENTSPAIPDSDISSGTVIP